MSDNKRKYQVVIEGNTGAEAEIRTSNKTGEAFVTLSLYTRKSYMDENGQWQQVEKSQRHDVIAYKPWVMSKLQDFKTGVFIRICGSLSYREFDVVLEDGRVVKKQEASIIAEHVEQVGLYKKDEAPARPPQDLTPDTDQTSTVFA